MYQQIMEQVVRRIAIGDWPPRTALPSIRQLATEIKVSVITVKRAYLELEREGVIVTQQGKGSWVNDAVDLKGYSATNSRSISSGPASSPGPWGYPRTTFWRCSGDTRDKERD